MIYNLDGEEEILEFVMWMIGRYSIPGDEPKEGSVEFTMYEFFRRRENGTLEEEGEEK